MHAEHRPPSARVLLVEDSPFAAAVACDALEQAGMRVTRVADGQDALEHLGRSSVDLVVTDWEMPRLDGLGLCRAIRSDPRLASLYLIFLTATSSTERLVEAIEAGADDYLAKPFESAELVARARAGARLVALQRDLERERDYSAGVISSMQDGLSVIADDGEIIEVNRRFCEMTGRSRAELVGSRPPYPHWPRGCAERMLADFHERLSGLFGGDLDLEFERPDGSRFPVIASVAALREADGSTKAYITTVKDVTERKRSERLLREREATNRVLAEEQAALREVATAVAAGAEPSTVFDLVAEQVALLLGVEGGGVARFDGIDRALLVGAWTVDPAMRSPSGLTLPLDGEGVTARVRRTGRSARVEDYALLGDAAARPETPRLWRSSVAAPVQVGGRLWGTVGAVSTRPGALAAGAEERLRRFAELVGLAIANTESRERLSALATTDPLTGLANRRTFDEALQRGIAGAARAGSPLAVAIFDIDHFKRVNDTHGHGVGDRVLVEAAARLSALVRADDTLARIGGEEFAWILHAAHSEAGLEAAERARRSIAAHPFPVVGPLTMSGGVAELAPTDDAAALCANADAALYRAKAAGRDRCLRHLAGAGPLQS